MILLAVVNGQPKEMGLITAIHHFIDHRVDVVRRRTAFLLQKAKDREHILEGYIKALDHLDNVITIIRGSANRADAVRGGPGGFFEFTQGILSARLHLLNRLADVYQRGVAIGPAMIRSSSASSGRDRCSSNFLANKASEFSNL